MKENTGDPRVYLATQGRAVSAIPFKAHCNWHICRFQFPNKFHAGNEIKRKRSGNLKPAHTQSGNRICGSPVRGISYIATAAGTAQQPSERLCWPNLCFSPYYTVFCLSWKKKNGLKVKQAVLEV